MEQICKCSDAHKAWYEKEGNMITIYRTQDCCLKCPKKEFSITYKTTRSISIQAE